MLCYETISTNTFHFMYSTFVYIYDIDVSRRMRSVNKYSFVFADEKSMLTERRAVVLSFWQLSTKSLSLYQLQQLVLRQSITISCLGFMNFLLCFTSIKTNVRKFAVRCQRIILYACPTQRQRNLNFLGPIR